MKKCDLCKKEIRKGREYSEMILYDKKGKKLKRNFYHAECLLNEKA